LGYRFESDRVNKILLGRFEGRFTNESAAEFYEAIRRYSTATDATAGVWNFSSVTQFAANAEFIPQLARSGAGHAGRSQSSGLIVVPASFLLACSAYLACFNKIFYTF
jgi:hypothetical protein